LDTDSVEIGDRLFPVWPKGQEVRPIGHRTIGITTFADASEFHGSLRERILLLENDRRFAARHARAAGGVKIYHLDRWEAPEAELLNARALHMAQLLLGSQTAVIDLCWATVSRRGDYAMPRSHERTAVSIVYCVDPGDEDPMDPLAGKLAIVDPRVDVCCRARKESVTDPLMPRMASGSMLAFPSALVHGVNPYTGQRPRISIAWNIDKDVIPGPPLPKAEADSPAGTRPQR
jgi:hypothetical protein